MRLKAFVEADKFKALSEAEQERMNRQLRIMGDSAVLGERIAAFK